MNSDRSVLRLARRWMSRRRLVIGTAFAAVIALLAAAVVHTPLVRSAVLRWAVARLQTDAGVRAAATQLDYNLFTLSFGARNTLAADGSDVPFFSAEALRFDLPWAILRGSSAVESHGYDAQAIFWFNASELRAGRTGNRD